MRIARAAAWLAVAVGMGLAAREILHLAHYNRLEAEGRLKSEFISVTLRAASGGRSRQTHCAVRVRNTGSAPWRENGGHYFAIGLFERSLVGTRRLSKAIILRKNGAKDTQNGDRARLSQAVPPGGEAVLAFTVVCPYPSSASQVRLQMVQEGVTWFGHEARIEPCTE